MGSTSLDIINLVSKGLCSWKHLSMHVFPRGWMVASMRSATLPRATVAGSPVIPSDEGPQLPKALLCVSLCMCVCLSVFQHSRDWTLCRSIGAKWLFGQGLHIMERGCAPMLRRRSKIWCRGSYEPRSVKVSHHSFTFYRGAGKQCSWYRQLSI